MVKDVLHDTTDRMHKAAEALRHSSNNTPGHISPKKKIEKIGKIKCFLNLRKIKTFQYY